MSETGDEGGPSAVAKAAAVFPGDKPVAWRLTAVFALSIPLGWGTLRFASVHPDWVEEIYSTSIFPKVRAVLRSLSGALPLHLAEVLLFLVVLGLLMRFRKGVSTRLRGERSWKNLGARALARLIRVVAFLYAFFLVAWGFNHSRQPYSHHMGYEMREVQSDELAQVLTWLVDEVNELRAQFDEVDWNLRLDEEGSDPRITAAYAALEQDVPVLRGGEPLLREAWVSPIMSRLGISGIYSPFTAESHVNTAADTYFLLFSAAHEIAHFKGFAREDEANYIAWQVCRRSDDPVVRYSATLVAMSFTTAALNKTDWLQARIIRSKLSSAVLEDLNISRTYWKSKRTVVTEVAEKSNDVYLKSQGQAQGRASYSRMVELIVAEWRAIRQELSSGASDD